MILFDTSVLIDCFTGRRESFPVLLAAVEEGEPLMLCSIVLYEWLRGPRLPQELAEQEELFPAESAAAFEAADARLAAKMYRSVKRPRTREADIAIAACAIRHKAELWTLNPADFADIPGLRLMKSR